MSAVTRIDDILHPGHAAEQRLASLDSQIASIDLMLLALSALDGKSQPPTSLDLRRPRLGANVIVVNGRNVDAWVAEDPIGGFTATEMEYEDEGRPTVTRSTIAAALHELAERLLDLEDICQECRDGECEACDTPADGGDL